MRTVLILLTSGALLAACGPTPTNPLDGSAPEGGTDTGPTDAVAPDAMTPDGTSPEGGTRGAMYPGRDVLRTGLVLDIAAHTGAATIDVAGSTTSAGVSLEVGDLTIQSVTGASGPLTYATHDQLLEVQVPPSSATVQITVRYVFHDHPRADFNGWMPGDAPTAPDGGALPDAGPPQTGISFLWPYYCGNLFPCHSDPADGSQFTMSVTGVPAGQTAVYPASIPSDAPTYMPAVALNAYTYREIGTTTAGTHVGVYYLPGGDARATQGTARLRDIFDWYETTYGAYHFGDHVASVEADWGPGDYGGMEHHPLWHVHQGSFANEEVHAHEAAHGWFGDGVRLRCWEDFVLSEGTTSYLAARAIEQVGGAAARDAIWADYSRQLDAGVRSYDTVAYPSTCNAIDIAHDRLWSNIPYMKGAYFYRAVEMQIGRAALDHAIRGFYAAHHGAAARMQDMIDFIQTDSGQDVTPLVNAWLRGLGRPAGP